MNSYQSKRAAYFQSNGGGGRNGGGGSSSIRNQYFDKNLVAGPKGPIDKSKKIMEKNAAKGQNSLTRYLGSQTYTGVTSN